jgi:hypothetical protein
MKSALFGIAFPSRSALTAESTNGVPSLLSVTPRYGFRTRFGMTELLSAAGAGVVDEVGGVVDETGLRACPTVAPRNSLALPRSA